MPGLDADVAACLTERVANWQEAQEKAGNPDAQWVGQGTLAESYSLRWYSDIIKNGMVDPKGRVRLELHCR